MKATVRAWAHGDDLWLRRAAMLSQRRLSKEFDVALFHDTLLANLPPAPFSADFFIRKGMGWALRERAYAAPQEVRDFCARHGHRLSALTLREGLRVIDARQSAVDA